MHEKLDNYFSVEIILYDKWKEERGSILIELPKQ